MRYFIKYRNRLGQELDVKVDGGRTYTNKRVAAKRAKELNGANTYAGRYVVCEV